MGDLLNLIVDLDFERTPLADVATSLSASIAGLEIRREAEADETVLAWIDECFGGWWSSEAYAAANVIATAYGKPVGFAAFDPRGLTFRWLRGVARSHGVGIFGPVGVEPAMRGRGLGRALTRLALAGLRERGYARALIPAVNADVASFYADAVQAQAVERFERRTLQSPPPRTLVLASGSGSNFAAVAERAGAGKLSIDLIGVLTNRRNAGVYERAAALDVEVFTVLWQRTEQTRAQYDERLLATVESLEPELVLLLGWMHLLDARFVERFSEVLNVHPAFLPLDPRHDDVGMPDGSRIPAFRGVSAIRDAIEKRSPWIGATMHRVTPHTDRGPVFTRRPVRLVTGEDEAQTLRRLHPVEHEIVAAAVSRWLYERA